MRRAHTVSRYQGVAITGEFKIYISPKVVIFVTKGNFFMKIVALVICAALIVCFLPVSGLDLARYPELQAKYSGFSGMNPGNGIRTTERQIR